jgi:Kef-type K+ transport system membrane component KefB
MVPRGEIGLIFALTGRQLGVFSTDIFAAVLLMVVVTSIVTPLALQFIVKRGLK